MSEYQNQCCKCGTIFIHHSKRAVVCHKCAFPNEHAVVEAAKEEIGAGERREEMHDEVDRLSPYRTGGDADKHSAAIVRLGEARYRCSTAREALREAVLALPK